jgi:putative oxidoreductase
MLIQNLTQYLPVFFDGAIAWMLLGLRLIWGIILVNYSYPMIKKPFGWMDLPDKPPSGFPPLLQLLGAVIIFGGGLAIIAGFLTPLAGLGLASAMLIALGLHLSHGVPFAKPSPVAPGASYDDSLLYLAIALLFVFLGSGTLSLDYLLFG